MKIRICIEEPNRDNVELTFVGESAASLVTMIRFLLTAEEMRKAGTPVRSVLAVQPKLTVLQGGAQEPDAPLPCRK